MTRTDSVGASPRARIAFALDYPNLEAARVGAELVHESVSVLKVGLELFVREGAAAVRLGAEFGCDVFLDLKLHDIPETVERAVGSAAELGVKLLTVHAGGGPRMLEAAARRAERSGLGLVAVTVLTSLDASDLAALGVAAPPAEHALRLARLAKDAGIEGAVCSVQEVAALRALFGAGAELVTPGIRPASAQRADDQKRVGTPADAVRRGASLLVVGRPLRDAPDPRAAARDLARELSEAASASAPA